MDSSVATVELDIDVPTTPVPAEWEPEVSQYDDGGAHVVVIDLPRVPSHSLCVCLTDTLLTVNGLCPRRAGSITEDESALGRFNTQVALPSLIQSRAAEVTFWR